MIHSSTFGLWYAVASSRYSTAWILGMIRPSVRFGELLTKSILLISGALYACRATFMSSIIRFSLVRLLLYIMSNRLWDSINICTGIGCIETNSNCLGIANASLNKSAKAITSADSTERATRHDLYDL